VHHALAHSHGDSVTLTPVHQGDGYTQTNGIRSRQGSGRHGESQAGAVANGDPGRSRLTIPDRNL
jgi:hypothetical protein